MKYEIRQTLQTGGGAIVNNASIAGIIAEAGISTYAAAKHGVIGLSRRLHSIMPIKGIGSTLVPGLVETAMTKPWFDDPAMRTYFMANSPMAVSRNRKRSQGWSSFSAPTWLRLLSVKPLRSTAVILLVREIPLCGSVRLKVP
jgi:short-subunit dehydrogenase